LTAITSEECSKCDGSGTVEVEELGLLNSAGGKKRDCKECGGRGKV